MSRPRCSAPYIVHAVPICRRFERHTVAWAAERTLDRTGTNSDTSRAIRPMTVSSSVRVKALLRVRPRTRTTSADAGAGTTAMVSPLLAIGLGTQDGCREGSLPIKTRFPAQLEIVVTALG